MTDTEAPAPIGTEAERALVDALRAALRGGVIDRHDPAYDEARKVWNGLIDRHPAVIARCVDVTDVIEALSVAREHRPAVSIRRVLARPGPRRRRHRLGPLHLGRSDPFATGGVYLNFAGLGDEAGVRSAALGPNEARLDEIRVTYDPGGLFAAAAGQP